MKKTALLIIMCFATLLASAQKQQYRPTITGKAVHNKTIIINLTKPSAHKMR